MRLWELFEDLDIIDSLRNNILDILTPLAENNIPYIMINKVIDVLQKQRPGIIIDRALIMQILDPDEVSMITKIEGDKIFFKLPEENSRKTTEDQKEKEKEQLSKKASDQAKKSIQKK